MNHYRQDEFLKIIRMGIGHGTYSLYVKDSWDVIEALAAEHGLSAVLVDGIEKLPKAQRPPNQILL